MIMYKDGGPDVGGEVVMVLKKGPWTTAEDETLAAYVREYGEGNWNAVQKKTWLARCGKSCRLRWANHLRPNLRKGSFSPHEERLIIQLHSQLGNKWARMAAQLPGRTDNEIKNYWNTRLKRFQRQGLPLYPPDILPYNHHQQQQQQQTYLRQPKTPSSDLPSLTTDSSFVFRTPTQPPLCSKRSYNTAFNCLSTNSSYTSSPAFLHSYSPPSSYPVYSMKQELPSNQIPYSSSLGVYQVTKLSGNDDYDQSFNTALRISTCQLLEDVMEEAEALADSYRGPKRRQLMAASEEDNFFSASFRNCGSSDNLYSLQGNEEEALQMNTMHHEDIAKLLDWGCESGENSNGQTTEDNLVLDEHQLASLFQVDDDNNNTNMNPTLSTYSWDNLPGIC